ncbi:MAG: regulatory iron-sulfur-containing complex subunit RicT [bacterium]
MRIAEIKINQWDGIQAFKFSPAFNGDLKQGDYAIIGLELDAEDAGIVENIREDGEEYLCEQGEILRKAGKEDMEVIINNEAGRASYLKYCKECVHELKLNMKLVDARLTFDGQKIIFAFTAEGRVDFRELVKLLNRQFRKSIRMHQIGIRDEAKIVGEIGSCGRKLCCKTFLKELSSVNSESAEAQQIAHRGADRISGICGRLMCCLNYEKDGYKKLAENYPEVGAFVKYEGKKFQVKGWHLLKQTLDLKIDENTTLEVEIGKNNQVINPP